MKFKVIVDTGRKSKCLPWDIVLTHGENFLSKEAIDYLGLENPVKLKEYGINSISIQYPEGIKSFGPEMVEDNLKESVDLPTTIKEEGIVKDVAEEKNQEAVDKGITIPKLLKMSIARAEKIINQSENLTRLQQLYTEISVLQGGKPYADLLAKKISALEFQSKE